MKILMFSTDRNMFDANSPVHARLLEQAALVSEIDVIVFTPRGEQYKTIHASRHLTIHPTSSAGKFGYLPDAYALAVKILNEKKNAKAKWLVSTQDPFETGALGYLISRKFKIPLHIQLHTDPFSVEWRKEKFFNRIRYPMALFLLRKADGVRVVSRRVLVGIKNHGVPEERITEVPIYVDVEHFQNAKPTFDLHRSYPLFSRLILSMGRLQPEKNFSGLIRAFARVHKHNSETMLLIVGSGPEREKLLFLSRALGVANAVTFLPWARDVVSYYKSCDVYVQPSLYEGWGMAVVEAMASGAPVVVTDVGLAGEVVRHEETGLVVPVRDEEALVAAIERLLGDETLRASVALGGKEEVTKLATKAETLMLYKTSWEKAFDHGEQKRTKK